MKVSNKNRSIELKIPIRWDMVAIVELIIVVLCLIHQMVQ